MAKKAAKQKRKLLAKPAKEQVVPRAKKTLVAISVQLEVITPDKLKKIIFGLTKGSDQGVTTWTINFELHDREKKADKFEKAIDLDVEVKLKNEAAAEVTSQKGLSRNQTRHLTTEGAVQGERLKAGKTTTKRMERTVQKTLEVR